MAGAGAGAEADVGSSPVADAEATPVTDTLGVFGDDERFDANDEGFLREDLNNDQVFEIGVDEDQSGTLEENEVLGSDVDNDEGLGAPLTNGATGDAATGDFASIAGDDNIFDANDEGFLSADVTGDGTNEIGFDEDASGTLDENEVLGADFNRDEGLTEDEFSGGAGADSDVPAVDFTSLAGDDATLDANDEGYLSGDVDGDGTNEIGVDEDASGTLEENEVLGTDANADEGLTEDEFTAGAGAGVEEGDAAATGDFASAAGDDNIFDANDEGFLFDPGTNEIGFDEDASGTLEENEVLGTDENNDEALTEDELGV